MDAAPDNLYFSVMAMTHRKRQQNRESEGREAIPAFFLYGEPLRPPDERLIHIETIAARSSLHNWKIRPHRHRDLTQVLLIQAGRLTVTLDAQSNSLRAPAIIVVPPATVHSFTFQPGTVGLVISFAPAVVAELAGPPRGFTGLLERPAALALARRSLQSTDLVALSDMLLREFGRSAPGRPEALRGLLNALLANLLRLACQPAATSDGADAPQRELVARFRRLIEARYRTHTGIDVYAQSLGVSESKLRRVCLRVTGQAPLEMLHLRLLVEAERQLRYTTMSIAQIAYHLGFEDPAYFSRFFARHTQLAPRLFRSRDGAA